MNWESIFDFVDCRENPSSKSPNFTLWNKIEASHKVEINQSEIVHQGTLSKCEPTSQTFKEHHFYLTKNKFFYKTKPEGRMKGFMCISFVKFLIISGEATDGSPKSALTLRFIRNLKYCDLKAKDERELAEWITALTPLMVRTDFHELYLCTKLLGEGSFAKVYLVQHKLTGQKFAVKAFSKEILLKQSKGKQTLVNEIEILSSLDHPNVMKTYGVHESKNSVYLVCEYIQGQSLNTYLCESTDFLTNNQIKEIVRGVLEALVYLEKNRIIHRDIKPDNIMMMTNTSESTLSSIKICDFGLATFLDVGEPLFTSCGTPGYVAPENLKTKDSPSSPKLSAKSDVFSLGVIMYLLITGESPFKGESKKRILKSTLSGEVDFSCDRVKALSPEMKDLLKQMLETNPAARLSAEQAISHAFFRTTDEEPQIPALRKSSFTSILPDDRQPKSVELPTPSNPLSTKVSTGILNKDNRFKKSLKLHDSKLVLQFDTSNLSSPNPRQETCSVTSPPPREPRLLRLSTQTSGLTELSPTKVFRQSNAASPNSKLLSTGENKFKITTSKEAFSPAKKSDGKYKSSKKLLCGYSLLSRVSSPSPQKSLKK